MIAASTRSGRSGLLEAAALDLLAGTDRDVDPGFLVARLLGLTGAGMGRGLAVVLLRCGDAVALLGLELRLRCRTGIGDQQSGGGPGEGGGGQGDGLVLEGHGGLLR